MQTKLQSLLDRLVPALLTTGDDAILNAVVAVANPTLGLRAAAGSGLPRVRRAPTDRHLLPCLSASRTERSNRCTVRSWQCPLVC